MMKKQDWEAVVSTGGSTRKQRRVPSNSAHKANLPEVPEAQRARRIRRVLEGREEKFLEQMQATHLARDPKVEDLYGETRHLRPIGGRARIREYLIELWQRRHFIYRDSRNRVLSQGVGTKLGTLWLILKPLLDAAFYFLVFGVVLQVSRGVPNFTAFIIIGVLTFRYTSSSISQATKVIRSSRTMIRSFNFPRLSIPISQVLRDTMTQCLVAVVMLIMIIILPPHALPGVNWLWFPVLFMLQIMMNLGLAFLFARFGFKYPDFAEATSFLIRILMYTSTVIFPIQRFESFSTITALIEANPIYMLLESYRTILINNLPPDHGMLMNLGIWSLSLFLLGFFYFWKAEESYAREQD